MPSKPVNYSVYCSFDPLMGWRAVRCSEFPFSSIKVVRDHNGRKLMRIPSCGEVRAGWFVNPKTICLGKPEVK